jgi:hydroxymethylbilane synthase
MAERVNERHRLKLSIGTRGSTLALKQVDKVKELLVKHSPETQTETKIIHTSGDKFTDRSIDAINERGVFTRTIDEAVLSGAIDLAVHSMKDVPMTMTPGLVITAVPERASPHDAFVSEKYSSIVELPKEAVIGTASIRRKAQLLFQRRDLEVKLIRGNVETRLKKLHEGDYDAIILAESGLARLCMQNLIKETLTLTDFTPMACQGALALVTREDNLEAIQVLAKINHDNSWSCCTAERAFMDEVGGGCKTPVGVVVTQGDRTELISSMFTPDGSFRIQLKRKLSPGTPEEFGKECAKEILENGGSELIKRWRTP